MESSDTIQVEDKISSDETVQESCCADDEVSLKGPHKCVEHDETAKQESAHKTVLHKDCAISASEPGKTSSKDGLDTVGDKEESWKSCIKEEITDSNGTNLQTMEATSQISSPQMIHGEKEIGNSHEKDGEKCKEEVTEEKKELEVSSCVDEIKKREENISVDVNTIQKMGGVTPVTSQESAEESNEVENRRSWKETQSTLMKEPFEREKGGGGDSFQKNANRYEERMRFSTRNQKNGLPSWSEGLRHFRQCLKEAEFLSCISPSEFSLPQDIRLYRHRSLFKPSFSPGIRKTVRKTKSATENRKLLKTESLSSSNAEPSENVETQEKPSQKPPTRNAKSIRRARGILFNRKINDSAVRKSLRQKLGALNAKKKLRNERSGSRATRKSPSRSLKSNGKKLGPLNAKNKLRNETSGRFSTAKISSQSLKSRREEDFVDKEKASIAEQCCENEAAVGQQKETELTESNNVTDKQFSLNNSPHSQKPSQIHPTPGRKSKLAHRKRKLYKSRGTGHQSGRYVKRCNFTGQLDVEKRSGKEQNVKSKLKDFFKRKVGLSSFPSNASRGVEHLQTSDTSTKSQMVREQRLKSNKLNFNVKRASTISQSSDRLLRQDADYLPESSDMSDSEMSGSSNSLSGTPASSRVGSPEIEIDVDLSQDCDAIQQDELMSQESRGEPPSPPVETGNVQPRKLPIFRKLPNPSADPVAVFYYNPEATMLRRCSKYHSCCQQSATAASVTKTDSSTQWEDPSALYDFLKLKSLPGLHQKLVDRGLSLPSYAIVKKKDGRYKIIGKSDVSLPHFSAILTATQDKKKMKVLNSGKLNASNSHPGSSQSASTFTPLPIPSTSGLQQAQDTPALKLRLQTPICASSSFQVVSQADPTAGVPSVNSTGVSARSISVLKDSLMLKHPPKTLVIKNSVLAQPATAGGTQPVALPSVSPGVEMHRTEANAGVDSSHFLFKDGILWQKVLRDDVFVWSKVNDGKYLIMNQLSPVPSLVPQSSVK